MAALYILKFLVFLEIVHLQTILCIFLGCGMGGLFRYWISNFIYSLTGPAFPSGTLVVNVTGAFLMGFLAVIAQERFGLNEAPLRALLLVGFLGGYTTFSTFSLETLHLIVIANYLGAALNILLSVVLCIGGVWIGALLGRQL